jgi:hypothetical protein
VCLAVIHGDEEYTIGGRVSRPRKWDDVSPAADNADIANINFIHLPAKLQAPSTKFQ